MLINKPVAVGDLVLFKLANGDEVIATISSESNDSYMLTKPVTVVPSQQGLGLMQSMFAGDKDRAVELFKSSIMMRGHVVEQMRMHYLQTTTDIKTVPAGIIT